MRDILFWGRRTFGELLRADEGIATNILASRLPYLESEGLIRRTPSPNDGRKDVFEPTERGIDVIPILVELVSWSAKHEGWHALEPKGLPGQMDLVRRASTTKNKYPTIEKFKQTVRNGGFIFQSMLKRRGGE